MLTFFHGWRRKIGVMTLVLALLCSVGWVRSRVKSHALALSVGKYKSHSKHGTKLHVMHGITLYIMKSEMNTLILSRTSFKSPDEREVEDVEARYKYPQWESAVNAVVDPMIANAQWHFGGFGFCAYLSGEDFDRHLFIPYWSIAIPLTLLSAYLLLVKPRVAKLAAVTEN